MARSPEEGLEALLELRLERDLATLARRRRACAAAREELSQLGRDGALPAAAAAPWARRVALERPRIHADLSAAQHLEKQARAVCRKSLSRLEAFRSLRPTSRG